MIKEGLFVTEATRTRQGYRTEPFYRQTFTLLLAMGASVVLTVLAWAGVGMVQGQAIDEANRLAAQENQVHQEEDRLHPTTDRIETLAALKNRIEKRVPAVRMLAAVEAALAASPNVCLRQV